MINIVDKRNCCGCAACVQRCPKQCIILIEDGEGFLYPEVDTDVCIRCGICEEVCPVLHQGEARVPLEVFAAKNPDEEIRRTSSSGGVFTALAETVLNEGGVVFGAKWNEHWEVAHDYTETYEELAAFRGSKYVQSVVGDTFNQVDRFLKGGRKVLYSGTPCQIAALNRFLGRDYDHLLTVDCICHGTPSPGVFRWYMGEQLAKVAGKDGYRFVPCPIPFIPQVDVLAREEGCRVEGIRFRDKKEGWKNFSFAFDLTVGVSSTQEKAVSFSYPLRKSSFLSGFLSNLYLRPSCYACPVKNGKSAADITLGDYWGIASLMPQLDDDRGISAVLVGTPKGRVALEATAVELHPVPYEDVRGKNSALTNSCVVPIGRSVFWIADGKSFHQKIKDICRVSFAQRVKRTFRAVLRMSGVKR